MLFYNVAALRNFMSSEAPDAILLAGYNSPGDGGDSLLWLDTLDTTSADNGVTVFVDSVKRRWRRTGAVTAAHGGYLPGNTASQNDAAMAGLLGVMNHVTIPDGHYLGTSISLAQGKSIQGNSLNTILQFTGTGAGPFIQTLPFAQSGPSGGPSTSYKSCAVSTLTVTTSVPAAQGAIGIEIVGNLIDTNRVYIYGFYAGYQFGTTNTFINCIKNGAIYDNVYGVILPKIVSNSGENIAFIDTAVANNTTSGWLLDQSGGGWEVFVKGGSIDFNGAAQVMLLNGGIITGFSVDNAHLEWNQSTPAYMLKSSDAAPITGVLSLRGCNFAVPHSLLLDATASSAYVLLGDTGQVSLNTGDQDQYNNYVRVYTSIGNYPQPYTPVEGFAGTVTNGFPGTVTLHIPVTLTPTATQAAQISVTLYGGSGQVFGDYVYPPLVQAAGEPVLNAIYIASIPAGAQYTVNWTNATVGQTDQLVLN